MEEELKKRGRPKKVLSDTTSEGVIKVGEKVSEDISKLLERIEQLEKRDTKSQEKLKMLESVADKGRVFNYESKKSAKKPMKVKLAVHNGNILIGWRTIKDQLIKHPTTGLTVGEEQQYEILMLNKEGQIVKEMVNSYSAFSDIRYTERAECEVMGKTEDWEGKMTFSVMLPDGRKIDLAQQFVN